MSFTAVILKLPFSALSTVRWDRGGEMLQERASGRSQPRSPPVPLSRGDSWLSAGSGHAAPPHTIPRSSQGEEVPLSAGLRLHVRRDGLRDGPGAGAAATAALGTSAGEVPQLFPANCFTYVLEKDMALSFRNHSSAQWVQQGANTCETPTEAAPSPFLKHFFCFVLFAFRENRLQAYLIQFSLCTIHI